MRTPVAQQKYQKRVRMERKAAGLCQTCGKNPAVEGLTYCQSCREAAKQRVRASNIKEKWPTGWCCVCGGEAPKGKKYCAEHMPNKEEWE